MRREHITDEVVRLGKEIAKHWPMEIYDGCWYECTISGGRSFVGCWTEGEDKPPAMYKPVSIPSIIDCVDKIKELKLKLCYRLQDDIRGWHEFSIWDDPEDGPLTSGRSRSPLEAALSALLGLLKREEEKKNFVR